MQLTITSAKESAASSAFCIDCFYWRGRCAEPTLEGRKSINRLALSEACAKFVAKRRR
jgi:hypothetical protein